MNSGKSAILFIVAIIYFVACSLAVVNGFKTVSTDLIGLVWIGGGVVFVALGIFLSYKLFKK